MATSIIQEYCSVHSLISGMCVDAWNILSYEGVQVHAAHGYLLSQFLSPLTNRRTDRYGGCSENRRRLLRDIITTIRRREGTSFAISVKINSADFQKGGFSKEESFDVVRMLCDLKVDLIEVSGGE